MNLAKKRLKKIIQSFSFAETFSIWLEYITQSDRNIFIV